MEATIGVASGVSVALITLFLRAIVDWFSERRMRIQKARRLLQALRDELDFNMHLPKQAKALPTMEAWFGVIREGLWLPIEEPTYQKLIRVYGYITAAKSLGLRDMGIQAIAVFDQSVEPELRSTVSELDLAIASQMCLRWWWPWDKVS